ncbi:MAG: amidohydrolase family protein, partial [Flavitalea sp.]
GIEDAKQAVKEHANNFVDVIKIVAFGERLGLLKDEMKAIVETAHELRMKVTAHATADWVVKDAVEAGVDGIEHAYDISDSTIMLLKSRNVYVVPTDPSADVFMRVGEVQKVKDQTLEKVNNELTGIRKRLKKMFDMGLMIVNGSDMYIDLEQSQGDGAKQSIVAYFESGLTAAESLRTATWNAAAALGKTGQYGALKEKHAADLVIFNGDLEKDFKKVLFQVKSVMKDGVVVYTKQ